MEGLLCVLDFSKIVDISENNFRQNYPEVLDVLLRDHTTHKNIFWATDNYEDLGEGFLYHDLIIPERITGIYGTVIMPRVKKNKSLQSARVRDMAEVFTPSWICNAQNNLIDSAWFGRENIFNTEYTNPDGSHSWGPSESPVVFPQKKSWINYVRALRLEITCGEAPYITSRYDTTTGEFIPLERRVGLLDRKLRIVNENTSTSTDWLGAAQDAYRSIYAYEWQGDSLLLAREAMLYTFIENYQMKFGKMPQEKSIRFIAYIISWNVWQMDGLKRVVPDSCHDEVVSVLFGEGERKKCKGCATGKHDEHNGKYCLIKDWFHKDPVTKKYGVKITYHSLFGGTSA